MKSLDIALVRALQFLVMLFFTFIVFLWYGFAALAPLALFYNLTETFHSVFGASFSVVLAAAAIGAIGYYLLKLPKFLEAFLATGKDLCKLGYASVRRIGDIAESVKVDSIPQEQEVEIVLKDKLT